MTVQLPIGISRTNFTVSLLDATGRQVWQRSATPTADGRLLLTVGLRPAGFYLVRLDNHAGYSQTQRLLVE